MFVNKVLFLMFGLLLVAGSTLYAAEGQDRYIHKNNALSVKVGAHFYEHSDFTDDWRIDEQDLGTFACEVAYERKTSRNKGIEFSLGYSSANATSENIRSADDSFEVDIKNFYLSSTVKRYLLFKDSFVFYGGIGPDFYYTDIDFGYKKSKTANSQNENDQFFALGLHGLVGVEYYLHMFKRPVRKFHNAEVFDLPVSLILEYKYSWVKIEDVYEANDLQVGGHIIFVGLRWHY